MMYKNTRNNKQLTFKNKNFSFHDFIDESFIKVFSPFLFIQKILGSCRVSIEDGVMGAPTIWQKLYTIIWVLFTMYSNFNLAKTYFGTRLNLVPQMSLFIASFILVTLVFCTSIAHARFVDNNGSVKLYNKMQEIDRELKIYKKDFIRSNHYKRNLVVICIIATLFNMLIVASVITTLGQIRVTDVVGGMWVFQAFVFDLSCCSSHLLFFKNRARLINSIMTTYIENESRQINTLSRRCASFGTTLKRLNFETSRIDLYMRKIFSGFHSVQERYKFQLFCFTTTCVFFLLSPMVYAIFVLRAQRTLELRFLTLDFVHMGTVNLIHVSLLLTLCLRTEQYLREIRKTKRLSIFIMSRKIVDNGSLRKKAKKMLKLIERIPPSFTVYGMWHVDARLVLRLIKLVTSTLVTILQLIYQ